MSEIEEQDYPLPKIEAISHDRFELLLEISAKLSSTLHLDDLLLMVMDVATELTDTQRASILLVDNSTGNLHFAASTDGEVPSDIAVPLDSSIAGWVVRHGRTVILGDVQTDDRHFGTVDEQMALVTRSMLAVPLITKKGVIGALEVLNKRDDAPYTGQDVAVMEALASQSAVAIMNASLFHQSDLLAEIMHEIKTPLMAITSASELLTRPQLPTEKHGELIGMIKKESLRLSQMTKDFLEFARLESGRERLSREPIDLVKVVEDVVQLTGAQADERHIGIVTELASELPKPAGESFLVGDSDRIKQVLLNLVSNAIKYNIEGGRITIAVSRNTAAAGGQQISLRVSDTGRGISSEDIDHLFERFYRIPGSERISEGSGMGLAIANKIVEEHGGRIVVTSELGKGTDFVVNLPLSASRA